MLYQLNLKGHRIERVSNLEFLFLNRFADVLQSFLQFSFALSNLKFEWTAHSSPPGWILSLFYAPLNLIGITSNLLSEGNFTLNKLYWQIR
jgi:hypothetical protein